MKRTICRIFLSFISLLTVVSCYKDEGNYDYITSSESISISDEMRRNPNNQAIQPFIFKLGQDVVIPAKYEILDPGLKDSDILFEWYMGGKVVSNESVLRMDPYPAGIFLGALIMTDLRFDQKYMCEFSFQVEETYTDGWAILSEKDDFSSLSYMHIDANSGEYSIENNVYSNANEGVKLPAGVSEMVSHMYDTYPQSFTLSIVKNDEEGPIELDIHSMAPVGKIRKDFLTEPAGIDFKSIAYMAGGVYALASNGDFYACQNVSVSGNVVPHSGVFSSSPMVIPGGIRISKWINASAISMMMTGVNTILAYDETNSRLVRINETKTIPFSTDFYANDPEPHRKGAGWDGTKSYDDISFPDPFDLSGYEVVDMAGCGLDCAAWDTPALSVFMLLKSKADGKYYVYTFRYFDSWGSIDVDLDLFFPLPEDLQIDPQTMILNDYLSGADNIVYFTDSSRKALWYFNCISGNYNKVYQSDSEITGFGPGEVQNLMAGWGFGDYTIYYEKFLVGDADGNVKVLKMDAQARASGKPEVLYSTNVGGKVKHIVYLPNQSTSY
jgi:hypothetical protein